MVYRKYDRHNNYETSFYEKYEISKKKKKKKKTHHNCKNGKGSSSFVV